MESDIKKLDKIFYCDYHKRVEEIKNLAEQRNMDASSIMYE